MHPTDRHVVGQGHEGVIPGSEFLGVVEQAAEDGSGPDVGQRVAGVAFGGAWAETVVAPAQQITAVPEELSDDVALSLPLAGASALRALRKLGPLLGKRVLVTGASGAVGLLSLQLAAIGGASEVVAVSRDAAGFPRLRELGATTVTDVLSAELPIVDGVLDSVGGEQLKQAFGRLAAGGRLVSVGRASGAPTMLTPEDLLADGGRSGRSIVTFFLPEEGPDLGADISFLLGLARDSRLLSGIDVYEPLDGDLALLHSGHRSGRLALRISPSGPEGS